MNDKITPEQAAPHRTLWISETAQIVSFHPVSGYTAQTFSCYDQFICCVRALAVRGFRFQ